MVSYFFNGEINLEYLCSGTKNASGAKGGNCKVEIKLGKFWRENKIIKTGNSSIIKYHFGVKNINLKQLKQNWKYIEWQNKPIRTLPKII